MYFLTDRGGKMIPPPSPFCNHHSMLFCCLPLPPLSISPFQLQVALINLSLANNHDDPLQLGGVNTKMKPSHSLLPSNHKSPLQLG